MESYGFRKIAIKERLMIGFPLFYDIYLKNHFSDYADDEIYNEYKYQIHEDNDDNMGGLIYSAFQVAKCAKIYVN